MKPLALILLSLPVWAGSTTKQSKPDISGIITPPAEETTNARIVHMSDDDIVSVQCRRRHDTMFIFPKGELITFAGGGDAAKGRWTMEAASAKRQTNIFHIKPGLAGSGAATNLNIITTAENEQRSYSFQLNACESCRADLKVFVKHKELPPAAVDPHISQLNELQAELAHAQTERINALAAVKTTKDEAEHLIAQNRDKFAQEYPLSMRQNYEYPREKKPFFIDGIWSDARQTYIQAHGEVSSVYQMVDGKPALLQFKYEALSDKANGGTYVIPSIVDSGYLQLGKKKVSFRRTGVVK